MNPRPALQYDVVVVGARVAGSATAMLLARRGLRVLVLDRARPGADTLSTHALMRAGVIQLRRWGLLDEIVAAGTPPVGRSIFRYEDGTTVVTIKPVAGVDALYAPRRTVIDRVIADAALAAGATMRYGVTVTGLDRDATGRVTGVRGRDEHGREIAATARIVVGADGVNSFVARKVGAEVERAGRHAGAVVYGYWTDLDAQGYEWSYHPQLATGMIPTNDGQVCVFAGTTTERFRALASDVPGAYRALLRGAGEELADRLAAARPPARLRSFPGIPGHIRRSWGDGWALVGDAGYFKDPLSTHGMTDALRDAELLARAIVDAAHGAPESEALAAYQHERDRLSRQLFTVVDEIASYAWDAARIRELLVELSSSMSEEVEALVALDAAPTTAVA